MRELLSRCIVVDISVGISKLQTVSGLFGPSEEGRDIGSLSQQLRFFIWLTAGYSLTPIRLCPFESRVPSFFPLVQGTHEDAPAQIFRRHRPGRLDDEFLAITADHRRATRPERSYCV
jgi:hypothetical protein